LGPGLHWGRSQDELLAAIDRAEREGMPDAAHHLRIILDMRNVVNMDRPKNNPADRETDQRG
jgi:hypothetical protein